VGGFGKSTGQMFSKIKLLWQLNKLYSTTKRESAMGYDWKVGAAKALRDFAITCLAVITAYYAIPNNLTAVLASLPVPVQQAAIPLLSSFFVFAHNWINNRNK
jgi:hypothetical protein